MDKGKTARFNRKKGQADKANTKLTNKKMIITQKRREKAETGNPEVIELII